MSVLEITLQHERDGCWPVAAEYRPSGAGLPQRSEGELTLGDSFEENLLELTLEPLAYGRLLGEALFQGDLRDAFQDARNDTTASKQVLRVLLVVEAPWLKSLRWEWLCAPPIVRGRSWDHLILDQSSLYSQYLPTSHPPRQFPPFGRFDLRALVVLADPPEENRAGLARFDAEATANSIGKALGKIPYDLLGPVSGSLGPASLDELCARITNDSYTLLHLVAHGQYLKGGETAVFLLDDKHQLAPIIATDLLNRLQRLQSLPQLMFLATCESAAPEAEQSLGGLAQRLVRELGIPAVVAMTGKVSIATAEILATKFYNQLRQHGEVDRALVEAGAGMQGRSDILVPALYSRLGGRPLFSDKLGKREPTDTEVRHALVWLSHLLPDRAPVLEDSFVAQAQTLCGVLGIDNQALSEKSRQELDRARESINALSEEVLDLSFPALALGQRVPDYDARCPFPGLNAFQTDEHAFFFGREKLVELLNQRLKHERFLVVAGISGSGKSSLVLAGMVQMLQKPAENGQETLLVCRMTPGDDPETALKDHLPQPIPAEQTVLVVDQFEELFTLCHDPAKRERFLDDLLTAWADHPNLYVVLTLRADFLGDCAPYPNLKTQIQAHFEMLPPMTILELRSAMEQQAASVGLRFEADLSHTILDEVKGEPGAMPLLQHLLRELWKHRHGRWLRDSEYRKLGGIKQAIAHTADEIYDELVKQESGGEDLMRNLFVRLTRLDDKSEGEEQHRDTRQRVSFDDLVPAGTDSDRVRRLVQRLANARLLVITADQDTQQFEVEVSHEALIRHWPRLRTWLDKDRESWMLLAAVRQQSKDWDKRGKKDGDLPRWGERLLQAEGLFKQDRFSQNELEEEFLSKARDLAEKERQEKEAQDRREREALQKAKEEAEKARIAAEDASIAAKTAEEAQRGKTRASRIGLGVAVALLLGAAYFGLRAYWSEQEAVKERERAEKKESDAYHQLAITNVNNAVDERNNNAPLKAAHYFAWASVAFDKAKEPNSAANFELLRKNSYHRPILKVVARHAGKIFGALFSADERRILSWSDDGTARVWNANSGNAVTPPLKHDGKVNGAVFSIDERRILTWSDDGTARIWNANSGNAVMPPLRHDKGVNGAVFSADEGRILTWSIDGTARVWDAASGKAVTPPLKHVAEVLGAVFSADQGRILTWEEEGLTWETSYGLPCAAGCSVRVWDAASGKAVTPPLRHSRRVKGAVFSADERRILTWGDDGIVRVWNATSGEAPTPDLKHAGRVRGAVFRADEKRILTWSDDGTARIWNANSGNAVTPPLRHDKGVNGALFSADQGRILMWNEHAARVWNVNSGNAVTPPLRHEKGVKGAVFSADERRILTWGDDGTVRVWDVASNNAQTPPLKLLDGKVNGAVFSADEKHILTWSDNGTMWVRDAASGEAVTKPVKLDGKINGAVFSADEGRILIWDELAARVWDATNGEAQTPELKHDGKVNGAAFSADEKRILTWSDDGTARVWDATSGRGAVTPPLKHSGKVIGAVFSEDQGRILTCSDDGTVRLWDASSGETVTLPVKLDGKIKGAVFSADERRVLTWSDDGTARIWNASSGIAVTPPLRHEKGVNGAVFSADQKRILTWSDDDTARLWDATSGVALTPPLKHEVSVNGALFSADQGRILTWSDDGTARVWDATTGEAVTTLKHEEGVNGALFSADQGRILTWSDDGTARVWDISIDTKWPKDQRVLRTEVETGTELTPTGELKVLSATAWQNKKLCEYDKILHILKRPTPEQWQTSQRQCRELKKRIGAMAPNE